VDHLGSVRDVVDNSGAVRNHIVYYSFGNITSQTDSSVVFRYGYTGREFDKESGLQYTRARYLDATNGRFISEDPIGFKGGDTNLSRYVGNNPIGNVDPTGLSRLFLPNDTDGLLRRTQNRWVNHGANGSGKHGVHDSATNDDCDTFRLVDNVWVTGGVLTGKPNAARNLNHY
jgi:RHS repeat-associated protein